MFQLPKHLRYGRSMDRFTVRGEEGSRLQSLSDGVFALAIAMLLISGSVPKTFQELTNFVWDAIPFAVCITFVYWIWSSQVIFFLRYGIQNGAIIFLNYCLLFFVLFYVYPLKFLMSWLLSYYGYAIGSVLIDPAYMQYAYEMKNVITFNEMPWLMIIYGLGFSFIFFIFHRMHKHVLKHKEALHLSPFEELVTKHWTRQYLIIAGIGALSSFIALLGVLFHTGIAAFFAGLAYNLIWINAIFSIRSYKKKVNTLED